MADETNEQITQPTPPADAGEQGSKQAAAAASEQTTDSAATEETKPAKKELTPEEKREAYATRKLKEATEELRESRKREERLLALVEKGLTPKQDDPAPADDKEPQPEDFETVGEYVKAVRKFDKEQAAKAEREREEAAKRQTTEKQIAEQSQRVSSEIDRVIKAEFDGEPPEMLVPNHMIPAFQAALADADNPGEVFAYLAKNPAELERIGKLSPSKLLVEVGKIDGKVTKADPPAPAKKDPPAPVKKPVGGGSSGAFLSDEMDQAAFEQTYKQKYGI